MPNRLALVASAAPVILVFCTAGGGVLCIAVDEGILVNTRANVLISVRNAIGGTYIGKLR